MSSTTPVDILVLEDDAAHGEAIRRAFKKAGDRFKIVLASSINEFFSELNGVVPALVITDARLPDGDVFDVFARLGENRTFPVIVMTSFGDEAMAVRVMKAGARDYIAKSADTFRDLPRIAEKVLKEWKQLKEQERLRQELDESREKFRSYVDNAPEGVFVVDETGSYVEVNRAACEITGYSEDELLSMSIADILAPESAETGSTHFATLLLTGTSQGELLFRHKDGSYRWWSVDAVKLSNTRYIGFAKDITERKTMEETHQFLLQCGFLSPNEDFFESLAKYLGETLGVYYVCIDRLLGDNLMAQTVAVYCDGKFEDNLEYALKDTPCGVLAGQVICYFPENVCALFPDDPALQDLKAESYIGCTLWGFDGKPIGLIALLSQKRMENRHLAESILKLVSARAAGELERRQALQQVRSSEVRYRGLMEQSCEALALVDILTKEVVEVNRRFTELFGYSLPEDAPFFAERYITDARCNLDRLCSIAAMSPRILPAEPRIYRHKNGTEVAVERTGTIINIDGRDYMLASMRDVTPERLRQVELARDVEFARRVQRELLPAVAASPFVAIRSLYYPAKGVSGDSYFMEWLSNGNRLRGFLIDVTGHGLAAALQTASLNALLRETSAANLTLMEQIRQIDSRAANYFSEGSYAALMGFELDFSTRELRYVAAGITQFYANGIKVLTPGIFLGMGEYAEFGEGIIPMSDGDTYFFLTDGFTDGLTQMENAGFWSPGGKDFDADLAALERLAVSETLCDDATGICLQVKNAK